MTLLKRGLVVLPLLLAACALTDVNNSNTPPPPMTLSAPPSLNFSGNCDHTKDLEDWLQVTTQLVANFQTKMNEAAGKSRNDAYQPTLELVAMRDSAYVAVTPDCANDIELSLSDAMNRAVNTLQHFVNGDVTDIANSIAEINTQFDQVTASQTALINRVNDQIQHPTATP